MRDSFVFYKSFWEAIKELPPDDREKSLYTIMEYALNGKEDSEISGIPKAVFTLIKPQIDANNKKYENGKKGGRPPKENQKDSEGKPNNNQNETKPEPNNKQGESEEEPNVNVNENVNDNGNDNADIGENSPPHFLIPVEFHKRRNARLCLTCMPVEAENLLASKLLRDLGDMKLITQCLDAFFDDSLDWWFTKKNKKDPKSKRVYHFGTFCKLAPAELVPYVREKTQEDQTAAEKKEHQRVRANPPKKCSCGGEIVQGTPEAARCTKCKKIYQYNFQQNSWGEVA